MISEVREKPGGESLSVVVKPKRYQQRDTDPPQQVGVVNEVWVYHQRQTDHDRLCAFQRASIPPGTETDGPKNKTRENIVRTERQHNSSVVENEPNTIPKLRVIFS